MIARALEVEILRLHHAEGWSIGTIARQLHTHHSAVRRVLEQAGVVLPAPLPHASMIDAYKGFILETLTRYPGLRASRLYAMARERGYRGSADHFRHRVALLRPRPAAQAYLRLRTLPGEQAQVDWAHFSTMRIGRAQRPLMAFVMVLSYSRMMFLRFYLAAAMGEFIRGHVDGFQALGVARILLYDNLKSAVLERVGDAIRFHPTLLELAAHYHFEPRPVAVARGNEKGRVERSIRYVRENFFAARTYRDLDDLNAQAHAWCAGQAAERPCPEQHIGSVREAWLEEQPRLLALPENPFPSEQRLEVPIHKTPYARFDRNDYSVPHTCVQRSLTVLADAHTVRILDGLDLVATHVRCYDAGAQIEIAAHLEALTEHKRAARGHRAMDRLHYAAPSAKLLYQRAAYARRAPGQPDARITRVARQPRCPGAGGCPRGGLGIRWGTPELGAPLHRRTRRTRVASCPRWRCACPPDPRSATSWCARMRWATTTCSTRSTTMHPTLSIEAARARLHKLGLYGLCAQTETVLDEPWLLRVIEIEETERAQRSLARRLRDAKLGAFKSIADFDWAWPAKCDRALIEELYTLAFVAEAANVFLIGPNGLGKTMLLKNIAHRAVLQGHSARFTLASDMLHDLAAQKSTSALTSRLRRYTTPTVLAIDEVGYLSYDARYADLFFEVVSRRYLQRPILLSTNKIFQDWGQVFPNAASVVTLVDRLVHRSESVVLEGESYRLKEAQERAARGAQKRKSKSKDKK